MKIMSTINSNISIKLRTDIPMKRPSAPPISADINSNVVFFGICIILSEDKSDTINLINVELLNTGSSMSNCATCEVNFTVSQLGRHSFSQSSKLSYLIKLKNKREHSSSPDSLNKLSLKVQL